MGNLIDKAETRRVLAEDKTLMDAAAKGMVEEMANDGDVVESVAGSLARIIEDSPEFKKKLLFKLMEKPAFRERVMAQVAESFS